MRPIDADQIDMFECRPVDWATGAIDPQEAQDMIDNAPTLEIEPIRYGHWIFNNKLVKSPWARNCHCSECNFEPMERGIFCPNCGAKMRKEDEE